MAYLLTSPISNPFNPFLIESSLTNLFFCENDPPQQLIFQSLNGDSEIDDGGLGTDLRSVLRIRKFCSDIKPETFHYIHLLVSNFHLNEVNMMNRK